MEGTGASTTAAGPMHSRLHCTLLPSLIMLIAPSPPAAMHMACSTGSLPFFHMLLPFALTSTHALEGGGALGPGLLLRGCPCPAHAAAPHAHCCRGRWVCGAAADILCKTCVAASLRTIIWLAAPLLPPGAATPPPPLPEEEPPGPRCQPAVSLTTSREGGRLWRSGHLARSSTPAVTLLTCHRCDP